MIALWRAQHSDDPPRLLAAKIESLWREAPGRAIFITADSSGCGVVLDALKRLPPEVRVRRVILSSPAVSRGYDLAPALAHVDGSIVSFNSDKDDLVLGLGTTLFGTTDAHHTAAAGRHGFRSSHSKLEQVSYAPAWRKQYGHTGGHTRALSPKFAKAMLAPRIVD